MRRGKQPSKKASQADAASAPFEKFKYDPAEEATDWPQLTVREKEVHYWIAQGKENAEIASILGMSPETARKHVENVRTKLGNESRVAMITAYWQRLLDKRERRIKELEQMMRK